MLVCVVFIVGVLRVVFFRRWARLAQAEQAMVNSYNIMYCYILANNIFSVKLLSVCIVAILWFHVYWVIWFSSCHWFAVNRVVKHFVFLRIAYGAGEAVADYHTD